MIRTPNRVMQLATYKTGTPNYLDLTGGAETGMRTVAVAASSDSWNDGDQIGVLLVKDDSNWKVWLASWDATGTTLEEVSVEDSAGTISDSDEVTISAALTSEMLGAWRSENVLAADRTYYVATTGSDSNDGRSSGAPFLTIQKAVNTVCSLDCSTYQATIQLADGTYTAGVSLYRAVGNLPPIIQGNSGTPANVVISTTSINCFTASQSAWIIKDCKLQTTTNGSCIAASNGAKIGFSNIVFGDCAANHFAAFTGAEVVANGNYTISGSAVIHAAAFSSGAVTCVARTVTLTGTPAFTYFIWGGWLGAFYMSGNTYSGSATGSRYSLSLNSACYVAGAASTYLPGDTSGTTATGGQYA